MHPFISDLKYIDGGIDRKSTTSGIASLSKSYEADEDGILLIFCAIAYTATRTETIALNGTKISPNFTKSAGHSSTSLYNIPVKKGDNINLSLSATNTANYEIFVSYFMTTIK